MDGKAKRIMVASKLSLEWWIATLEDKKKKQRRSVWIEQGINSLLAVLLK